MTCITYSVAGVALDDPLGRWSLRKGTLVGLGASVRGVSSTVPGVHGTVSTGDEVFDEAVLVLKMQVRGSTFAEMVANYSGIAALLAATSPVEVARTVDGLSRSQMARGRTIDQPEFSAARRSHTFTATLRLPSVFWRGPSQDWTRTNPTPGTPYEVTTLAGSTAPVADALVLVTGPANQPRVTSGPSWVELGLSIPAGQKALIDCAAWTVRLGSGVTFDGGGSLKNSSLITSGGPYVLPLRPKIMNADPTDTAITVALSAASGMTSATAIAIRGRSSHLG